MKVVLPIPAVQLPEAPSFYISNEVPKVRMPLLSLLVVPRSLAKWYFIWGFCLYLAVCLSFYFMFERPRLERESYIRFGADSPTYWEAAEYRSEHADAESSLISFSRNMLGPVAIATVLKSGIAVAVFNIILFFLAVEVACSIPGVDRYRLLFLLAICAETPPALITLNKEILVLVSTFLLAKYVYSPRRSWILLGIILMVSLFARWEQIAIILLFLFLQRKGSFFYRNPRLSVASVIAGLTVLYTLLARLPGSGIGAFTQYAKGAGTIAKLNTIQASFGFPLVLVPKVILDVMGELLRPMTYLNELQAYGVTDIHTTLILPLFSVSLVVLLVIAYRRGLLNPRRPLAQLILIYMITTAVTPFVQPRYNYFVYVLLCLELARKDESQEGPQAYPKEFATTVKVH
jgi:hypothetical protein